MKYEVVVGLKPEVLDPEGRAIQETLNRLGHGGVKSVAVTKRFVLELESGGQELVQQVAKDFLANPVSETFTIRELKS